jgi:hypothetical protein
MASRMIGLLEQVKEMLSGPCGQKMANQNNKASASAAKAKLDAYRAMSMKGAENLKIKAESKRRR